MTSSHSVSVTSSSAFHVWMPARYNFNVDGVATINPRNPAISESNNNVWSLVYVPGSDRFRGPSLAVQSLR